MFEKPSLLEVFEDQARLAARFPRTDAGELGWLPAIDVRETPHEFVLLAALPGVDSQDIIVDVERDAITLHGRRKERQDEGWLRREMIAGPFCRKFETPSPIRAAEVSATHKDGILEVHLPKEKAQAQA